MKILALIFLVLNAMCATINASVGNAWAAALGAFLAGGLFAQLAGDAA